VAQNNRMTEKSLLKAWIKASRPPFYIATLIPLTIGWILAARGNDWHPGRFLLVNLAAFAVHMATNLVNDYFDHLQGADAGKSIGGSRVIQEGVLSLTSLRNAILFLYGVGAAVGFYLMGTLNLWPMFPMLLFSLFSSIFYVAPPVRYGYRGLGELFVGINMGPIMVIGTYWVFSGRVDWIPLWVSIPIALMVASILYYQSLPDMETDRSVGKKTLSVRLGPIGAFIGLIALWAAIYLSVLLLTLVGILSSFGLLSLLTIPVFLKLIRIMRKTANRVELDRYGKYVRILYFLNGCILIWALMP
jgi:1,4-dihydroxy-2-naphthoate polyprenyltransferase